MKKETTTSSCKLSRWTIYKQGLNNIKVGELADFLNTKPEITIIDVRRAEEYAIKHIPNAINIDYLGDDYWPTMEKMDKNQPYLIYCKTGRRSLRACMLMKNGGFKTVYNLDEGFTGIEQLKNKETIKK